MFVKKKIGTPLSLSKKQRCPLYIEGIRIDSLHILEEIKNVNGNRGGMCNKSQK